jgi:hypothetical protein
MALWGKSDGIYSPGTVEVDFANKRITGTGSSFRSAGIETGTVINVGAGITLGGAVITGILSETTVSIATTQYLVNMPIVGVAYTLTEKPIYTLEDKNFATIAGAGNSSSANKVYGVDIYEVGATKATKYAAAHAGWVGVHTYTDMHGNFRVKSEVLVAMSGITTGVLSYGAAGDANDDVQYPDTIITITTQPTDLIGVSSTSAQSFTVVATSTPTENLTYQWQYASSVGAGFTDLTNDTVYSDVTTATVGIASTSVDVPDGFYYRVSIQAVGTGATAMSDAALLDYA